MGNQQLQADIPSREVPDQPAKPASSAPKPASNGSQVGQKYFSVFDKQKLFEMESRSVLFALQINRDFNEREQSFLDKTFTEMSEPRFLEQIKQDFNSKSNQEKRDLLKKTYATIKRDYVDELCKKLKLGSQKSVLFDQVMKNQVLRFTQGSEVSDEVKRQKLLNALSSFVANMLPSEHTQIALDLLGELETSELEQLTSHDRFKEQLAKIKKQIVKMVPAETVHINKTKLKWVCERGDVLMIYKGGYKRVQTKADDMPQLDKRETAECTHCGDSFKLAEKGFVSCMRGCPVYLCWSCSRCANGHLMTYQIGKVPSYRSNGRCDRCRTNFNEATLAKGFYRCDKCSYDVCLVCLKPATVKDEDDSN